MYETGKNFGTDPAAVSVSVNETLPCDQMQASQTRLICFVPAGTGQNLTLYVDVAGQLAKYEGFDFVTGNQNIILF